jgi:hypothetical protein
LTARRAEILGADAGIARALEPTSRTAIADDDRDLGAQASRARGVDECL